MSPKKEGERLETFYTLKVRHKIKPLITKIRRNNPSVMMVWYQGKLQETESHYLWRDWRLADNRYQVLE